MDLIAAFPTLHKTGFGVLDVGSRGGLHPIFDEVAPVIDAIGFEPDIAECERLNQLSSRAPYRSIVFLPFGLGDTNGQQPLNVCRLGGVSSVYRPNQPLLARFPDSKRFEIIDTISMPVRKLDDLVHDSAVQLPAVIDFMKIDTQGSELNILRGAEFALMNVMAMEVEVEFARLYESQPLFRDVDQFLSDRGFTLCKLRRAEWVRRTYESMPCGSAGQIIFGDALYIRDPLSSPMWTPKDSHEAEALILSCLLYDLNDFALELLLSEPIKHLVEVAAIQGYIYRRSTKLRRPFGHLRTGRDFMRWCKRLLGSSTRYSSHWSRGDGDFYACY